MIRAFVGVRIDPNVAQKISALQSRLKGGVEGIRWVGRENIHFTLKFLGPVKEERVEGITEVLRQTLRPFPRFPIIAKGVGVFPDIRKPRVLWVGLEGKSLAPLATDVENALEPLGFAQEKRAFKPHLTIGRWRDFGGPLKGLKEEIERWKNYDFGESWVEEVVFFQSVLKPQGAVYSPLGAIALSN